jgi:hypothetical protein
MEIIRLTDVQPACDDLLGEFLDGRDYECLVKGDATVLKPDGSPLLIYARDALPRSVCVKAFRALIRVPLHSDNRGLASGGGSVRRVKRDGTVSATNQAPTVESGVLGYLDRTPRIPYCRMSALTLEHFAAFRATRQLAVHAGRAFKAHAPEHWAAQQRFVDRVPRDFQIEGAPFTTITVNRNWRTAAHRDAGDYRAGMGVMSVLAGGSYAGCELIFPRFRAAVDMRTGGVCLADVHELHGNAPLVGAPGCYTRLSLVFYAREAMTACGTVEQEREAARAASEDQNDEGLIDSP